MDATVQLMLYRACQLPSTERTSKIDAYVKVVAGTQTVRSATVQDNENPEARASRPARRQRPAAQSCSETSQLTFNHRSRRPQTAQPLPSCRLRRR